MVGWVLGVGDSFGCSAPGIEKLSTGCPNTARYQVRLFKLPLRNLLVALDEMGWVGHTALVWILHRRLRLDGRNSDCRCNRYSLTFLKAAPHRNYMAALQAAKYGLEANECSCSIYPRQFHH